MLKDGLSQSVYEYDANGNRISYSGSRGLESGVYDAQDRMHSFAGNNFTYNDNGELLTKTDGSDVTTYDYDVFGNLLKVVTPDASVIEYVIDGRYRRIGKKINGTLVQGLLYQEEVVQVLPQH